MTYAVVDVVTPLPRDPPAVLASVTEHGAVGAVAAVAAVAALPPPTDGGVAYEFVFNTLRGGVG